MSEQQPQGSAQKIEVRAEAEVVPAEQAESEQQGSDKDEEDA